MAQPNPVKVLELCRVAPQPDSTTSMSLPLTFFDMFLLRSSPTQQLFFYELSHPTTTFLETVLPKLKRSLSLTLQHYLPVVGNVTWAPNSTKPIVEYVKGDTVSLTVAESEADFYRLSGDGFRNAKEFLPFVPCLLGTETRVPTLALQVTLFPNVGFSIGYAVHHGVMDGKTTTMFMHSWAFICARGEEEDSTLTPELTPFFDRTLIIDPSDLGTTLLNFGSSKDGPSSKSLTLRDLKVPDAMHGTVLLTQTNIENIKRWVQSRWELEKKEAQKPSIHVSSFAITTACTWVCLAKARQIRAEKVYLVIPVDCRGRLKPPIPPTYFGNCVSSLIVDADVVELTGEDGVSVATKAIAEAIRGLKDGVSIEMGELIRTVISIPGDQLFTIVCSPRFGFYNTDFGWGRPRKVETISIDNIRNFWLSDPRDGNSGIEIRIVLKEDETEAFESLFVSGLESHQIHNPSI